MDLARALPLPILLQHSARIRMPFEMNWEYDDARRTVDKHSFFKFMIKSVAEKHGLRATFMDEDLQTALGKEFSAAYLKLKHGDWNSYSAQFTAWERQTTLDV